MKKILYKGIDSKGKEKSGFVEAENNSEVLSILKNKNIYNIILHNDEMTAFQRNDLEGLSEKELNRIAKFEINMRSNPGVTTFLIEVLNANKYIIFFGVTMFVWGCISKSYVLIFSGGLAAISMPVLSLWNYRIVGNYNNLIRNCSLGQWAEAIINIKKLRPHLKQPEMAFDLDVREACIIAKTKSIKEALTLVEKWENNFHDLMPGMYESRVASIFHAAGDYSGYVGRMRDGYIKSLESPVMITDLALAEAQFGDVEKASSLLAKINIEELPIYGLAYIDWAKGVVAKRQGDSNAMNYLGSAVSKMLESKDIPAIWTGLALCSGAYAIVLNYNGEKEKARLLVNSVWDILKIHGDKPLLKEISNEIFKEQKFLEK